MATTKISQYAELDSERRCDAEHITAPIYLNDNYYSGADVSAFTQYGTSKQLNEHQKGFPVLRLNEFEQMFIKTPEKHCNLITEAVFQQLRLSTGDVLVCRTNGNPHLVGKAAVVMEDTNFAYASYVFKVKPNHRITPQVLTVYLNSKYGRSEIERHQMISIQTNFSPERFKKCRIPCFSQPFQTVVSDMVNNAYANLKSSKSLYIAAEQYLLTFLGLNDFVPSDNKISIRGLAESFHTSNRIDAEYYQDKYDQLEAVIRGNVHGCCSLGDIGDFTNGSLISDKFYVGVGARAYIRIKELSLYQPIKDDEVVFIDDSFVAKNETTVKTNDFVIATIGNTIGKVNVIPKKYNGSFISNNTSRFRLKSSKAYHYFIELLMRNIVVQEQVQKLSMQTAQPKIGNEQLRQILIPTLHEDIQRKLDADVQRSFALRHESERLLDMAKRAVELAIEEGEDKALKWLGEYSH